MKKYKIILLVIVVFLIGCAKDKTEFNTLPTDFVYRFDMLFLSEEPLRYQDNVALLKAINIEQLNLSERKIIRIKLRKFLSHGCENRSYTKNSYLTGVASPCAFLRLESIQLLGDIGEKEDISFIESLWKQHKGDHSVFEENCNKAIEKLKKR